MSKLETAFSKALKEKGLDSNSLLNPDTQALERGDVGSGASASGSTKRQLAESSRKVNGVVSAKKQIGNMVYNVILSEKQLAEKGIIFPRMRDKSLLNGYRNLRTKLLADSESGNFVTMVTPLVPDDKQVSLISANLAATFAFDEGKTSLLVEGNIYSSELSALFDLDASVTGLIECIESEELPISGALHETGIPRLRFLPRGKARVGSGEVFTSDHMKSVMTEIKERYPERYPIINAPSVVNSADARILLDLCDRVLLVVPYGLSTKEDLKAAAHIIGREKLAGIVLSQFQ